MTCQVTLDPPVTDLTLGLVEAADITIAPAEPASSPSLNCSVIAVPGSGKTWTLSRLAANIIAGGALLEDQEVLVVTLVNSAVDNFSARISQMVEARGLIPHLGYRVRTLHGLAHDIVREKPSLAGLEDRFQIVDDRESEFIRKEAANAWLSTFPNHLDDYFDPEFDTNKRDWVRRQHLPDLVHSLGLAFIRTCKNYALTPDDLRAIERAARLVCVEQQPGGPVTQRGRALHQRCRAPHAVGLVISAVEVQQHVVDGSAIGNRQPRHCPLLGNVREGHPFPSCPRSHTQAHRGWLGNP